MWTGLLVLLVSCAVVYACNKMQWNVGSGLGGVGMLVGLALIVWALVMGLMHWMGWLLIPAALVFGGYCLLRNKIT